MNRDASLRERAKAVIPGGMWGHMNAHGLPPGYPQFFARAKGTHVTDVDGNEYIDEPRTPRGDTDLPLSDAEISQKFHSFADPVLGPERANKIEALSTNFDTLDANSFSELMDLCLTAP